MAQTQGTVRMNISVPAELKKRMDDAADEVNWSGVAAEAFRAKLLDLDSKRKGMTMEQVIARLKEAAEIDANQSFQDGHAAGSAWAKTKARPKELRRLDRALEQWDSIEEYATEERSALNRTAADQIAIDITGGDDTPSDFWEGVLGDDRRRMEEEDYARGFVEGAVEVWEAAKPHL